MTGPGTGNVQPQRFSKAFGNMVAGDDDVVGLLAYALYKRAVREDATNGNHGDGVKRDPSPTTVTVHRDAAKRLVTEIIDRAIEDVRPELEASALRAAVAKSEGDIRAHIDRKTDFWSGVLAGVIAWLLSLMITIMILWLSGKSDVVSAFLKS